VPTYLTGGFGTPEDAIKVWIYANGLTYSGDCDTGGRVDGTYCSSQWSTLTTGRVYISGTVASEPAYWMLLRHVGGLWYVQAVSTFSGTGAPPSSWH
jgi:hypothetical protein